MKGLVSTIDDRPHEKEDSDHTHIPMPFTVTNQKDSKNMTTIIPTIAKVDYDTTMGKGMIVYEWRGTSAHNKRVHGGEIMLKSLLGFRRYLHVNCTGLVTEGRYPEDVKIQ